jgi:hypothetical protein
VDPSQRHNLIAAGRAEIKATQPIPPQLLEDLRGHTVSVYPSEIALAWAYRLNWRPIPVLQSYAAYTASLDRLDADFLASSRAPDRILLQGPAQSIDGRVLAFDQGMTTRSILCRYQQLRASSNAMALGRGPDRCSSEKLILTEVADWGKAVPVPAPPSPHSLVSVRVYGAGIAGLERLVGLLWRPPPRFVSLNGGPAQRFITGTATDGLPLRASPGLDYQAPFNLVPQAKTIAVGGKAPTDGRPITYRFYSQSFAAP